MEKLKNPSEKYALKIHDRSCVEHGHTISDKLLQFIILALSTELSSFIILIALNILIIFYFNRRQI